MKGYGEICIRYHNKDKNLAKRNEKTEVHDVLGSFVVNLCGLNIPIFFKAQLTLNEYENNCGENLNDIYYKRTVSKLNYTGW